MRAGDEGWTFIETIIVLGIILILTATVGFMAARYLEKAKEVAAKSQIETFQIALQSYFLDCGSYPSAGDGLAALWQKPASSPEGWTGPYIAKAIPKDPWKKDYVYQVPGPNGLPFAAVCYGADGTEGGEGANADIASY